MNVHVYQYTCLTNLHVGSGDVNYNIIDNEVECDPATGYPVIHASGVKGALREHFSGCLAEERINYIFGSAPKNRENITGGAYKFLDARFLLRPMRVGNSATMASIPVVSVASVNGYLQMLTAFGVNPYGIGKIDLDESTFAEVQFLTNCPADITVEGEPTGKLPQAVTAQLLKLKDVIGDTFAVVKEFGHYPLPVTARNYLVNGESKNLWYEEVVPYGSVFYQVIITPEAEMELPLQTEPIQFGGHATIGCGFIRIKKLGGTQ